MPCLFNGESDIYQANVCERLRKTSERRAFNGDDPAPNRDLLTFVGASYFQGHEPTDPLVSPLFGDLAGLPPLFVTASQGEVLLSDSTRLAERRKRPASTSRCAWSRTRPCLSNFPIPTGDQGDDEGGRGLGA